MLKIQKEDIKKPFILTAEIHNHKNGHFIRPNRVTLNYLDFKKNVNLNVHVKLFNFVMKANENTSKEYILEYITFN
jgi:hypothetical protein